MNVQRLATPSSRSTSSRPIASAAHCLLPLALALVVAATAGTAQAQLNQTLHTDGWILAAAHSAGEHGSIWRTDLWISFASRHGGSADLYLCEQNRDGSSLRAHRITTEPGKRIVYIEDVVDHLLGIGSGDWLGAIHYVADRNVQVYARIYSVSADGSESYGQIIEGIPTSDMSIGYQSAEYTGTDEDQWIFAAKHTSDNRFRVNIGVVNPTPVATHMHISVFDGGSLASGDSYITFELPPFSMRQLSDPFASLNGGDWSTYMIRLEAQEAGSGVLGYASVVDNATNDAYLVRGVKLFRPDE
jgi:hypothetical protein